MKNCTLLLIVAVFTVASTGCTMVKSGQNAFMQTTRMFRPRPFDGPQKPDSEEDPWAFVGEEGRADRDRERDPDRWWRNLMMSQQARDIETNLGID